MRRDPSRLRVPERAGRVRSSMRRRGPRLRRAGAGDARASSATRCARGRSPNARGVPGAGAARTARRASRKRARFSPRAATRRHDQGHRRRGRPRDASRAPCRRPRGGLRAVPVGGAASVRQRRTSTSSGSFRALATSRCRSRAIDPASVSHFWERECSIQRQRQKLIEMAPALGLAPAAARADARGGGRASAAPPGSTTSRRSNFSSSRRRRRRERSPSSRPTRVFRWSTR